MKRFLSTVLAVAMLATMFAGISVGAANATVIESFVDIDFANWDHAGTDTNKDGSASGFSWFAQTESATKTLVADVEKGKNILKVETTPESGYAQFRINLTNHDYFTRNESQWYEWSVKYEGGFAATGFDHDSGMAPVYVDNTGMIRRYGHIASGGDWDGAKTIADYQLELGKWYHIVVCMDTVNAPANDGGRLYVWVNGQKIFNGADYSSMFKPQEDGGSANFKYYRFFIDDPTSGKVTTYLDNIKAYITDEGLNDTHAVTDCEVNLTDADADDGIDLADKYIVAEGKTFAEVKSGITGARLVAVKDGVNLQDSDLVNGAKIYAWSPSGIGCKVYTVPGSNERVITKNYVDVNFDNWNSGNHNVASDGAGVAISWAGEFAGNQVTQVAEKDGKVLQIPVGTEGGNYYVRGRFLQGAGIPSTYADCSVLWTEFSIKYDGGFVGFGFGETDSAYNLVTINKSGYLELGARWGYGEVGGSNFNRGMAISNSQLEVGKWYHVVYAVNFKDATAEDTGAPVYIWINGNLVASGVRNANIKPSSAWLYHKLWVDVAEAEGRTVSLDNLKVYETKTLDSHAEEEFAVTVTDANEDDAIRMEDNFIIVPKTATVADVKAAIAADNYLFIKDGIVIDDEDEACGAVLIVKADNAIGYAEFKIADRAPSKDILGAHATGISTSINTANGAHPVGGIINDGMSEDADLYKSACYDAETPLVVTITLDAWYILDSVKIFERNLGGQRYAKVEIGKYGVYKTVADEVALDAPINNIGTTSIPFAETEGDAIRITFTGTPAEGQQTYQIWEIEAYGTKAADFPVLENVFAPDFGATTSIRSSIPTRVGAHPVTGIINGNREFHEINGGTDDSLYKSSKDFDAEPLTVLITLNDTYELSSFKVFERRCGQAPTTVSVFAGKDGEFTEVATDVALDSSDSATKASENTITIVPEEADAVKFVFENAGGYEGQESSYQISEIEAYGEKVEGATVADTAILPGYCFWEETSNSMVVAYSNATGEAIEAVTLIAAYEGDKMVAVSKAREMTISAGIVAQFSMSVNGIKQDGRTYKAFVFDSLGGLKPLMKAELVG